MKTPVDKKGRLQCNICRKFCETLGAYCDPYSERDEDNWWICWRCFNKADALAAKENRWPDANDFASLAAVAHGSR